MPFLMIRNDITKVPADAVVNPANVQLCQGSGASKAIYLAAGEDLLERACKKIGHCRLGESVITEGFGLQAKYIIHTVGPVWRGGWHGEQRILYRAYRSALELALKYHCESIAFPLLSSGSYGFPKEKAMRAAISAISDFLMKYDMLIYMVVYDKDSLSVSRKLSSAVKEYIDDNYIEEHNESFLEERWTQSSFELNAERRQWQKEKEEWDNTQKSMPMMMPQAAAPMPRASGKVSRSLDDLIKNLDETFSQMLLRLIDERGLKDSVVYKKANIDRRHFSKIRNDIEYAPTKKTVFAFSIALELSLDEAKDLMNKAGYSISRSSRFDVIISYFLENKIYNIFEINEVLFSYGQPILGE